MKTIAFFNNKGGVGKTTLLYHTAWMFSELGLKTLAVDFDPQSNLTSMFFDDFLLDGLWDREKGGQTIVDAVAPLLEDGTGDVRTPSLRSITPNLSLLPGDLGLARMEDQLSVQWLSCLDGKAKAFRSTIALHRAVTLAAEAMGADVALIDLGPNLGALNRSALLASEHVVVPLIADLFSRNGLRILGATLQDWRGEWQRRLAVAPSGLYPIPSGGMRPTGYVMLLPAARNNRTDRSFSDWAWQFPLEYRMAMKLPSGDLGHGVLPSSDPLCLAQMRHFPSMMPMAIAVMKPMFHLTPADGAIGSHVEAVAQCRKDFELFARRLAGVIGLALPPSS